MAKNNGPISDLSYRGYEGKLDPPKDRWKVIARTTAKLSIKSKGSMYWIGVGVLGTWYFLVMMLVLFVMDRMSTGVNVREATEFFGGLDWDDQFIQGFGQGCFAWLMITVGLGAGAIANDNRSNAMLVYFSKPCTKRDYLIGKWVGLWVPLTVCMLVPSFMFYMYGVFNYRDLDFISHDPLMIVKLVPGILLCSAFYTSLMIGISSLFKQGRIAGATMFGAFMFPYFFVRVMSGIIESSRGSESVLLETLSYFSIDRITSGIVKLFLDSDGAAFMGGGDGPFISGPPSGWLAYCVILGISAVSIAVAWKRSRAVEVVA